MFNKSAGMKKKRVSKRNKSSWRKHVDISDVDNFLEEQRFEERLGKLSEVADSALFTVDTTPATETKLTSKEEKRLRLRTKPLRCKALLKPFSNVPDPISKRNRVRTKDERKNEILKKKEDLLLSRGVLKQKQRQSLTDIKKAAAERAVKPQKYEFTADLWQENDNADELPYFEAEISKDEWITGDAERHLLHGPGKRARRVPIRVKKSVIEAIELPHPGMSYNPSFEDHQALLMKIVDKEKKIIKEEEHLDRVTKGMFRKVTVEERDTQRMNEMSQGIINVEEEVHSDSEFKSINPPTENKKKSLQQRRKQKEQVQLKTAIHKAKIEKKKVADIHKLKFIKKSIEKGEKKAKMLHEKRLKALEYKKKEAKRLAPLKFEEPELEFNMGKDIAGNLRNLKIEGNLLNDRIKSLQKRSVIEPTTKRPSKKPKVKRYQKHKADWKKTVAKIGLGE